MQEEVVIEKLVHGGQGLATLADGRKVFVWGVLPGERVLVRIIKRKRSYAEAVADTIIEPSPQRLEPREAAYLSTSPWQIMPLALENEHKKNIVRELFSQAHVELPDFTVETAGPEWNYRNKMEYSFWGDDAGLHLALYGRGTHRKHIVEGSVLALPAVDAAAQGVLAGLRALPDVRAGDLKTVIVRAPQDGRAAAALFVKRRDFPRLPLPENVQGLRVYYSNPKSPASVPTELLYELGDARLHDTLGGKTFTYDVDSFFQINLPVYERALQQINSVLEGGDAVDMYAGVGSIGLSVAEKSVQLVELDAATAAMARLNAAASRPGLAADVIESSSEKATDYILGDKPIIFDPPRAGLHEKVTEATLQAAPPQIIYLSCNPATQARDIARLLEGYKLTGFSGYNFFPHTPHIETLAVLTRKG